MAKYTFLCSKCNLSKKVYSNNSDISVTCDCGETMIRQVPSINQSNVTEVVDSYLGVALQADNAQILKDRKDEHFWKYDVPRLVNKYSVEHCLQNNWLFINDKGELEMHTKPPNKR